MLYRSGELEFAYDNETDTFEETALEIGQRFGVYVSKVSQGGAGGWPGVELIGTPAAIARCVAACWATGDEESDADLLAEVLTSAERLSRRS